MVSLEMGSLDTDSFEKQLLTSGNAACRRQRD